MGGGKEAKLRRQLMRKGLDAKAAVAKAAEDFAEVRDKQQQIEEAARAKLEGKAKASARQKRKRLAKEVVDPTSRQKAQPEKKRKTSDQAHHAEAVAAIRKKMKGDPRLTVFVGQLPFTAAASDVEAHFLKAGIPNAAVRMLTEKSSNTSRGMAFVQLISEEDVTTALGLHQSELQGRWINVERSSRRHLYQESSDIGDAASAPVISDLSVFVGQLPYSATVESIREHFENSGVKGVSKVKLISEKGTNKKGMAFVQLSNEDGVQDALKLHKSELSGRSLVVERSSKKEAKQRAAQVAADAEQPEEQ